MKRSASPGTAAIEFALAMPFLLVLVLGVVELGYSTYQAMRVADAAEAGAVYASKYGFDAAGIEAAVTGATGPAATITSPAPFQFCGCPGSAGVTTVDCSTTCTDGSTPGVYIQVNASMTRESILPYPDLGLPTTLTAQSTVRVN